MDRRTLPQSVLRAKQRGDTAALRMLGRAGGLATSRNRKHRKRLKRDMERETKECYAQRDLEDARTHEQFHSSRTN